MRLKIKGYHLIKSADIQFDSLTVIVGENDTGKSTLNFSLPNEVSDLVLRISQPKILTRHNNKFQMIKKLINGEVYYDSLGDNIFYKKEGVKNKLDMYQTANGIKMFGFLQILILNGAIKKGSFLIFDEPEIHLHPKWQLEYAKIIVYLVKEGIKVLVNSHSPYMMEALELYSKNDNINTNFYLANKVDEYSIIENVTNNLELIYQKLAEPINSLELLDDTVDKETYLKKYNYFEEWQ